jgi:hypothetical protein
VTCTVVAANATGPGPPVTSVGVLVAVPGTLRCPKPSGRLSGTSLGPLALGFTQAKERALLPRFKVIGYGFDNFCLYGGFGIRVGYPSSKLLGVLPAVQRARLEGRIVLALTANPYYMLDGITPGTSLTAAAAKLKLGKVFAIGRNDWYITAGKRASGVLKVRNGIVDEVGIATKQLTQTRSAQKRLLSSFHTD